MSVTGVYISAAALTQDFLINSCPIFPVWDSYNKRVVVTQFRVGEGGILYDGEGSMVDHNSFVVVPIPYWHYSFNRNSLSRGALDFYETNPVAGLFFSPQCSIREATTTTSNRTKKVDLDLIGTVSESEYFKELVWVGKPSGARYGYFAHKNKSEYGHKYNVHLARENKVFSLVEIAHMGIFPFSASVYRYHRKQGPGQGDVQYRLFTEDQLTTGQEIETVSPLDTVMSYNTDIFSHLAHGFLKYGSESDNYMGVELEYCTTSRSDQTVKQVREGLGGMAICKHDGSIEGDGFEVVTLPATLRYHKKELWNLFDEKVKPVLQEYHDGCGIHIHVNRRHPETSKVNLTKAHVQKLAVMVNCANNVEFTKTITGRRPTRYCRAADNSELNWTGNCSSSFAGEPKYSQLNTSRTDTIEFRMFKASGDKHTIFTYLEFVHSLVEYTRQAPMSKLSMVDWCQWFENNNSRYFYLKKMHGARIKEHASSTPENFKPVVRRPVNEWTFKTLVIKTNDDLLNMFGQVNQDTQSRRRDKIIKAIQKWVYNRDTLPDGDNVECFVEYVKEGASTLPSFVRKSFFIQVRNGLCDAVTFSRKPEWEEVYHSLDNAARTEV